MEQEKRFHTCQRFYVPQATDRPYTGVTPSFPAAAAADVLCHNTLGIGVTLFNPVEGGEGTENLPHTGGTISSTVPRLISRMGLSVCATGYGDAGL